jgi:CPA2 family monovalent cation:H+ antiporter-2
VLVVAIADPSATRQIVAVARRAAPGLKIVVRTRYVSEVDALHRLGADAVVPEEFETSLELAGAAMAAYGVPGRAIEREKVRIRQERYASLAAGGHAAPADAPLGTLLTAADLDEVVLGAGGPAHGRSLRDLDLRGRTGASVVAVARVGELTGNPPPDFVMQPGDVLWVWGQPEQTEAARELLQGDAARVPGPAS